MKNGLNIDIFNIKMIFLYFKIRIFFNKNTKKINRIEVHRECHVTVLLFIFI